MPALPRPIEGPTVSGQMRPKATTDRHPEARLMEKHPGSLHANRPRHAAAEDEWTHHNQLAGAVPVAGAGAGAVAGSAVGWASWAAGVVSPVGGVAVCSAGGAVA